MTKFAYQIEPRLLVVSLVMTVAVALPSSLVGLWLARARRRRRRTTRGRKVIAAALALAASATLLWWLQVVFDRLQPTVPRPHLDRDGGACRVAARDGRDHRPPGAARVPRPAGDPAPSHLRSRPPVHVAVLHARLGGPAGHRRGAAGHPGQPGARAARRVRGARRGRRDLAAGRRAGGPRARGAARAADAPPVRPRHHRAARARSSGSPATGPPWPSAAGPSGSRCTGRWPARSG